MSIDNKSKCIDSNAAKGKRLSKYMSLLYNFASLDAKHSENEMSIAEDQ